MQRGVGALSLLLLWSVAALGARRLHNDLGAPGACSVHNPQLAAWLTQEVQKEESLVPKRAENFESFLEELKAVLDRRQLPDRPIHYMLSDHSPFHPTCAGDHLEFGVFNGATLNLAATAKSIRCGPHCAPVFGFDTFSGLPEDWARGEGQTFHKGAFDLAGKLPVVPSNVQLIRGIFADSLPLFEQQHARHTGNQTISYLHVDCDLYAGTRDIFTHLSPRIRVGTVIVFDELVNYNKYREGEVKALWEWLHATGARLATLGMLGPINNTNYAMDLHTNEPNGEHPWFQQSVAFVVAVEPISAPQPDLQLRHPILLDAEAVKHQQAGAQPRGHQHSHEHGAHRTAARDHRELTRHEAGNLESYVPVKELESDPEGNVFEDMPATKVSNVGGAHHASQSLPADTIEGLGLSSD